MKPRIIAILLIAMMPLAIMAQRRGHNVRKQKAEEPAEDPRITQMRATTRQVTFVDSMVVDKDNFISHIPLSAHCGKISQAQGLATFTNQMGDHRLTTTADTVIATSDFIANRWTTPAPIEGIGEEKAMNPFLMPDGVTLYYAQKGERSIGGFDIFVTRYDSEKGIFLKPENVGMPFASTANDLFYAIDEFNQLGYFVTDRIQQAGKVCIYVFIPTETRLTYSTENYTEQQLRKLSDIATIASTWTDKQAVEQARERLSAAQGSNDTPHPTSNNAQQTELEKLQHQADVMAKALLLTRNYYATAPESEQQKLRDEILRSEQQIEQLQLEIKQKQKLIPQ